MKENKLLGGGFAARASVLKHSERRLAKLEMKEWLVREGESERVHTMSYTPPLQITSGSTRSRAAHSPRSPAVACGRRSVGRAPPPSRVITGANSWSSTMSSARHGWRAWRSRW